MGVRQEAIRLIGHSQRRLMLRASQDPAQGITVTSPKHYQSALAAHGRGLFARPPGTGHHYFVLTDKGRDALARFRVIEPYMKG